MKTKRVDLKLGFKCNNFCRFCIQKRNRNKSNKKPQEVKRILEEEAEECIDVIFTGGEPTIYEELIDYISHAKDLGYRKIQIQTNGRMFSSLSYCKELIDAGANIFNPALHGSNSEIHDYLTRAQGSFDQVLQGLKNLKKLDQKIFVNTVVTKINYKDLVNITELLMDIEPTLFQCAFIHINSEIKKNKDLIEKIVPRYKDVVPEMKKAIDMGEKSNIGKIETEAVPFCLMKGYEDNIAEINCPETNVHDADRVLKNFTEVRISEGKARGDECKKCKYFGVCEGVWEEYPEIFGWDEFEPVKSD